MNVVNSDIMPKIDVVQKSNNPYLPKENVRTIVKRIKEILENGQLMQGKYVKRFEEQFARFVGTEYAVAVNSGTSALQGILNFFDIQGREVLVPVNTFLASSNAVLFEGGIPVFVDIDPKTLCVDVGKLEKKINKKTKGVMVVHLSGLITPDVEKIRKLCKKHKLFLIEDAAHAHGSSLNGKKAGSLGDAAAFSMLASKVMTSGGEGGMVTTNNKKIADRVRSLRFHGEDKTRGIQDRIGYSWRMTEMQAIVGIEQVNRLQEMVNKRMAIAYAYDKAFKDLEKVTSVHLFPKSKNAYYKYPLILDPSLKRLSVKKKLEEDYGVKTGTSYWPPCHLQPAYVKEFGYKKGDFLVAEDVLDRTISLPISAGLLKKEIRQVIEAVKEVCG